MSDSPHRPRNLANSRNPTFDVIPTTDIDLEISRICDEGNFGNLVFERNPGQSVVISNRETLEPILVVTVTEVRAGNHVRVAFRSPREIGVDRDVVYLRKVKQSTEGGQ